VLPGYYNGGVVNDNCMQQFFSWDLGQTIFKKDILGQEFCKKGKKNHQLKYHQVSLIFYKGLMPCF
jgi:hypothetical protein